ncbi:hypothetical protein [Jiangella muralis]|uniref:hypothetical protein n=1 Tax=Jiangella muralis TaxID=702383 RepID=UPI00069DF230|nr:hypothetical protein [Jiangella muralis]
MSIETNLRAALEEAADDALPVPGLAATAWRRARRRRTAARSVVAVGAVAAVAVPAGMVALGRDDDAPGLAAGADIQAEPEWRELTGDELTAAVDTCFAGHQDPAEAWDSLHGVQLTEPASPEALATWVVAGPTGEELVWCALPSGGDGYPQLPLGRPVVDEPEALIVEVGMGAGSYADPATRVTVQYADGPEQDAVLWNGYWFDPTGRIRLIDQERPCEGPLPYVVRAYADDGELLSEVLDDGQIGEIPSGTAAVTCQP